MNAVTLEQFSTRAAGLPSFSVGKVFGKLAASADGYTPRNNIKLDSDLDNAPA